ncbi:hypothetical protein ENBRE01_0064 [Enteropsectra breve]|nr:hypothetical protein ENBRE01_0064 [Enteropsectra breve]
MANLLLCALLWKHYSSMPVYDDERMFEKQFQVSINTKDSTDTFDLRDLFKSKVVEQAVRGTHLRDIEATPRLKVLLEMYDLYENALSKIKCSIADTHRVQCEHIQKIMMTHNHYDIFLKENEPADIMLFSLHVASSVLNSVFKLTNGWCHELRFFVDDETISDILMAFNYLELDHEKQVDVFFKHSGAPLHLRIKTIDLFCINVVYLLETHGLLEDYRSLLTAGYKTSVASAYNEYLGVENKHDRKKIAALIKKTGPLAHYICLLHIKMEKHRVKSLFLGTESVYFVYDLLHEENCKSIRLQHKNDFNEESSRLDLIVELNTLSPRMINRKLNIMLPFCRDFMYKQYLRPLKFNSNSVLISHSFTHLMGIFNELTEVCISNLIHFSEKDSVSQRQEEYVYGLLIDTVLTVIKQLPGLNALFIRGFHKFPDALIPVLKKKALKKFGAMSTHGALDYLVIYRLFDENSPLKKSITHFVGHFRALIFISKFLPKNQIKEATLAHWIAGARVDFFDDEKNVVKQIRKYFKNGCLYEAVIPGEALEIDTFYCMELSFLTHNTNMNANRPLLAPITEFRHSSTYIWGTEIVDSCTIRKVVACNDPGTDAFLEGLTKAAESAFKTIKIIEIIVKDHEHICFESMSNYLRYFKSSNSCLILNINVHRYMSNQTDNRLQPIYARDFSYLIRRIVFENNMTITLRLRRSRSSTDEVIHSLMESFKNEYENQGFNVGNRLRFEYAGYNIVNESSLKSIRM